MIHRDFAFASGVAVDTDIGLTVTLIFLFVFIGCIWNLISFTIYEYVPNDIPLATAHLLRAYSFSQSNPCVFFADGTPVLNSKPAITISFNEKMLHFGSLHFLSVLSISSGHSPNLSLLLQALPKLATLLPCFLYYSSRLRESYIRCGLFTHGL